MTIEIIAIIAIGIFGALLTTFKYWEGVRELWRKTTNSLKLQWGNLPPILSLNARLRPFCNALIDYFIVICVTCISLYSTYLFGVKKTSDETRQRAVNLLELAKSKCIEIEIILTRYVTNYSPDQLGQLKADSLTISEYYKNSVRQPFYIVENTSANQILSYISLRGYEVLSSLEFNEQFAMIIARDTSVSYTNRHKTLNAALKFDSLRWSLIELEEKFKKDDIDTTELEAKEEMINRIASRLIPTLNPKAYNVYFKDIDDRTENMNIPWDDMDSLNKYSYLLFGFNNNDTIRTSMCFFIRKGRSLYLVGDYTSFTSWDVMDMAKEGSQIKQFPDTLKLRLFRKLNDHTIYIPIPIKKIKKSSKMRHYWDKPAYFFYKIEDSAIEKDFQIYSIEKFIDRYKRDYGTPYQVFYSGIPTSDFVSDESYWRAKPILYKTDMVGDIKDIQTYNDLKKSDSLNYLISECPKSGIGGAPLFFRVSVPDGSQNIDVVTFGGMYFGTTNHRKKGRVIRPEEFIYQIANLK